MTPFEFKKRLADGRRVYGTLIVSTSPVWPEAVAQLPLDFVFIDTEHVPLDRDQLSWMCRTYKALGLPVLVRIPQADPWLARMVIDGGASGVVAPYVETAEQVVALSEAVRLRPIQGVRLAAHRAGQKFEPNLAARLARNNGETLLIVDIESRAALAALDDILAVPGLDAVLVGPHDLTYSLGIPEQYEHEEFEDAVRSVIRRARARGIAAGVHSWMGNEREGTWARAGANLIIHEADIVTFLRTAEAEFRKLRKTLGDHWQGRNPAQRAPRASHRSPTIKRKRT